MWFFCESLLSDFDYGVDWGTENGTPDHSLMTGYNNYLSKCSTDYGLMTMMPTVVWLWSK